MARGRRPGAAPPWLAATFALGVLAMAVCRGCVGGLVFTAFVRGAPGSLHPGGPGACLSRRRTTATARRALVTDVSQLRMGQKFRGMVDKVSDTGAFVDIGVGKVGLLRNDAMLRRGEVRHAGDVVRPDEEVDVWVCSLSGNAPDTRFGLSLYPGHVTFPRMWTNVPEAFRDALPEDWFSAEVTRVRDTDLVVKVLAAGGQIAEAVVPAQELPGKHVFDDPFEAGVRVGDAMMVRLLKYHTSPKQSGVWLYFSARPLPDPSLFAPFENVTASKWLKATATRRTGKHGWYLSVHSPDDKAQAPAFVPYTLPSEERRFEQGGPVLVNVKPSAKPFGHLEVSRISVNSLDEIQTLIKEGNRLEQRWVPIVGISPPQEDGIKRVWVNWKASSKAKTRAENRPLYGQVNLYDDDADYVRKVGDWLRVRIDYISEPADVFFTLLTPVYKFEDRTSSSGDCLNATVKIVKDDGAHLVVRSPDLRHRVWAWMPEDMVEKAPGQKVADVLRPGQLVTVKQRYIHDCRKLNTKPQMYVVGMNDNTGFMAFSRASTHTWLQGEVRGADKFHYFVHVKSEQEPHSTIAYLNKDRDLLKGSLPLKVGDKIQVRVRAMRPPRLFVTMLPIPDSLGVEVKIREGGGQAYRAKMQLKREDAEAEMYMLMRNRDRAREARAAREGKRG